MRRKEKTTTVGKKQKYQIAGIAPLCLIFLFLFACAPGAFSDCATALYFKVQSGSHTASKHGYKEFVTTCPPAKYYHKYKLQLDSSGVEYTADGFGGYNTFDSTIDAYFHQDQMDADTGLASEIDAGGFILVLQNEELVCAASWTFGGPWSDGGGCSDGAWLIANQHIGAGPAPTIITAPTVRTKTYTPGATGTSTYYTGESTVTETLSDLFDAPATARAAAIAGITMSDWGRADAVEASSSYFENTTEVTATVKKSNVQIILEDTDPKLNYVVSWIVRTNTASTSCKTEKPKDTVFYEVVQGHVGVYVVKSFSLEPTEPNQTITARELTVKVLGPDCIKCDLSGVAGQGNTGNASVEFNVGLGMGPAGNYGGYLQISEKFPSLELATPKLLKAIVAPSFVGVLTNSDGSPRQIYAPQALVDIVASNAFKYYVRFYAESNGVYLTNGSPFVTWTVENPDASTNSFNKLRILEIRGAQTVTNDFEWNDLVSGWALTKGGLSKESKFVSWNTNETVKTEVVEIRDPQSGNVISWRQNKYQQSDYGEQLIQEILGNDGTSRTNSYSYDGSRLSQSVRWDGSWSIFHHDSSGRVIREYSAFGTQGPTTNASLCRLTEYSYTAVSGSGDAGTNSVERARMTTKKLLNHEIERSYLVLLPLEEREIRCQSPGADWDDANNLVTITKKYDEDADFPGKTLSISYPNGTLAVYEYEDDVVTNRVTTVYAGAPDMTGTNVIDGTKTVTLVNPKGALLSVTKIDILSNIIIAQETYSDFDLLGRAGKVTYLNGDAKLFTYSCCNLESERDETGLTTSYTYDALKRRTSSTRAGVSMINLYDAANRVVAMIIQGTNSSQMLMSSNIYNTAGERVWSMDALGYETTYAQTVSSGVKTVTTTLPDLATSVQVYYRDGSEKSVWGTANHGIRYEYGVESEGGVYRSYTKQIRLNTNGSDSSEWVKNYANALGNTYRTLYPDDATELVYFNSKGQVWKQVDADGVVTLLQYNAKGQREYTVLDVDRNDTIDFSGTDRITRSLSYATNAHGVNVARSETWQWQTLGANTPVLISTSDRSVETKESWQFVFGLTNYSIHVCVTNLVVCYSTNKAPDGSYTVSMSQYGLPLSSTRYDSNGVQLAQQSMGYDAFNRTITMTDARTGTITNTLDALGRTLTRTTPAPAPGQTPQMTQTDYDLRGRLSRTIQPDGGVVLNTYYDTGELKKTYGNRTYPVEYTYDYAGRMKTLKTWQDFQNDSGAAVTTWNYDSQRGFMTSKRYADNKGPDYEYTLTGKLAKRTWARGVETDYTYNDAGDLETVDYSDGTPDVAYTYDRMGRKATTTQGTQDAVTLHYTAAGQLAAEQHTSGLLSGVTVTNAYDGLLRRTVLTVLTNGGSVYQALYGYDAASRMLTVSDGTNNATYGYVTNSSLVSEIAFKQNSTLRMTTTKQYDLLNRLTNISSTTASFTNSFAYLYNDANQRTKVTREDGSYWNYGYDDLGQVTSGKHYWADNAPVAGQQYDYDFDDIGNRKSTTSNSKPETRNSLYTANLLNQYTSRTVPGYADVIGSAKTNATVTVNYQRAPRKGEYWHKELALSNTVSAVYAGVTNIAVLNDGSNPDIMTTNTGKLFLPKTPEQFTYDDDGNLTGDGRWTYTWDGENRLIQMEAKAGAISAGTPKQKLEFAYDDQWRRIQKKLSDWNGSGYTVSYTNKFAYDSWNLLVTFDSTNLRHAFLWGNDVEGSKQRSGGIGGLVAFTDSADSSAHFETYDGNGNVVALIDSNNGGCSAVYEYGPFGEVISMLGYLAEMNPFQFSTKFKDIETGLLFYGFRYYSAKDGRWMGRDPIEELGGENLFAFAENSCVNFMDYLGAKTIKSGPVELHDPNPSPDDKPPYKVVATATATLDYPDDECKGKATITLTVVAAKLKGGNPISELALGGNPKYPPNISPSSAVMNYSNGTLTITQVVDLKCDGGQSCNVDMSGEITIKANPNLKFGGGEGNIFAKASYTIKLSGGCACVYSDDKGTSVNASFGGLKKKDEKK